MTDDNTDLRQELEALADEWEDEAQDISIHDGQHMLEQCAQELREVLEE